MIEILFLFGKTKTTEILCYGDELYKDFKEFRINKNINTVVFRVDSSKTIGSVI